MIIFYFILVTQQCEWIDEKQNKYDYSSLDLPNAWHIPDTQNGMGMFNMVYIFNFCKIELNCHNIPVAVYEGLEVMGTITDNCDIVGLQSTKKISHIDGKPDSFGISISFNDNSQCVETVNQNRAVQTDKPRTAIFNIVCSQVKEKQFRITQGYGCTVIFEIYHPAGCPLGSNWGTEIIFFIFLLLFMVFWYNKKIGNLEGMGKWKQLIYILKRGNRNGYSLV